MWNLVKRHSDRALAAGLGLAMLVIYAATAAPAVLYGDSGELQLAAARAGIAHPTGYPLYLMLGWLWTHLWPTALSYAGRLNLMSAFFAASAVALLFLTVRRFLRQADITHRPALDRGIALIAAALLGVSPLFWSQAVIAEVYALNALIVAGLLYFLLRWLGEARRPTDLVGLALVIGLGFAHHRTILFWLPAVALTLWLAGRAAPARRIARRRLLLLLGLMVAPLLLYLFIPLRAPASTYLTVPVEPAQPLQLYDNSLSGFMSYVLGRSFEGSLQPSLLSGARLSAAFDLLRQQFTWFGVILGVMGLLTLTTPRRRLLLSATLPTYILLVAFNLIYAIGDIAVYYIPTFIIWVIWCGAGVAALADRLGSLTLRWKAAPARPDAGLYRTLFRRIQVLVAWLAVGLISLLPIVMLIVNLPGVSRRNDTAAWLQWQQILAQDLPEGSVLVSNDRDDMMPLWYFQRVEGQRPDLIGLFPKIVADGRWDDIGMVLDRALASGRPVYLIKAMPGLEVKVDTEPAPANLIRVRGLASACPSDAPALDIGMSDKIRLYGYTRVPYSVAPGGDLTVTLCWESVRRATANYATFVQILDRAGNRILGSDHIPGGVYYPISLWKPGEKVRDAHRLAIPKDLPAGSYRLYAGMYLYPSMERLGDADLGFIGVKTTIWTQPRPAPVPTAYTFDDKVSLLGYELRKEGQSLLLSLEWQTLRRMGHNYTTFVHLIDAQNKIVAQADSQPLGGSYPTSIWDQDEIVMDAYRLPIEMDMPKGRYRLRIGLYRLETMGRLTVYAAGKPLGDYVELQEVAWP
jgi:hypothetical protein